MRARGLNIESILRMFADSKVGEIAREFGVTHAAIVYQIDTARRIPERIKKLEAKIARLERLHAMYLDAKRKRPPLKKQLRAPQPINMRINP